MAKLKERIRCNWWEKVTFVYCTFILGIFPILTGSSHYTAITEFKYHTFTYASIMYAGICLLMFIYALIKRREHILDTRTDDIKMRVTLPQLFLACYVIWAWLSVARSSFTFKECWVGFGRYEGLYSINVYITVFFLVSFFGEYSENYPRFEAFAIAIFSIIAVFQLFKDGVIYPKTYTFWSARFMSTMGNVDMVGGLVSLMMPFIFCSYVFSNDNVIVKRAYLVIIALFTALFILADVDSGKMGLLAGFAVSVVYLIDTKENLIKTCEALSAFVCGAFFHYLFNIQEDGFHFAFGKKTLLLLFMFAALVFASYYLRKTKFSLGWTVEKTRKISWFALAGFVFAVLLVLFMYKGENLLLHDISEALHFRMDDSAGSGRGYIWKNALSLAKNKPLLGHGAGTFGEVYKHLNNFRTYTDFAHNDFIQIAVQLGFVGDFLYIGFIVSLFVRAIRKASEHKMLVAFMASFTAYLAHSFFSFSLAIITPIFWVTAGLMEKMIRQIEDN